MSSIPTTKPGYSFSLSTADYVTYSVKVAFCWECYDFGSYNSDRVEEKFWITQHKKNTKRAAAAVERNNIIKLAMHIIKRKNSSQTSPYPTSFLFTSNPHLSWTVRFYIFRLFSLFSSYPYFSIFIWKVWIHTHDKYHWTVPWSVHGNCKFTHIKTVLAK